MLRWSRYNTLIRSERSGNLLYSSISNSLLELDEQHYLKARLLEEQPEAFRAEKDRAFIDTLSKQHILVDEGEDESLIMRKQYNRYCDCYGQKGLSLTICPTLACNFNCPYCFEQTPRDTTSMSEKTVENLLAFIREQAGSEKIHVDWYGGEPTLAFDTIIDISERMLSEGLDFKNAQMTTNGYLLDKAKSERLNDLKIDSIQITLDGTKDIHDSRRTLPGGEPTFQRILDNIDSLMHSSYRGKCDIRVNIDKTNRSGFVTLRETLLKRYKGKKVAVYPARVKHEERTAFDSDEWAEYCMDLYDRHGIITKHMLYPKSNDRGSCIAQFSNSFVAGPSGELYKCWEDVGIKHRTIGNVNASPTLSNDELTALYSVGTDQYARNECRECFFLPICGNACPKKRLEHTETCTHFKRHLQRSLEIIHDVFTTAETGKLLLDMPFTALAAKGYRIIYPAMPEE